MSALLCVPVCMCVCVCVCMGFVYQDLHLVEAGQLPHVPEGLQQVLEEDGGCGDQVLVGLVFVLVEIQQQDHPVCGPVALQQLCVCVCVWGGDFVD